MLFSETRILYQKCIKIHYIYDFYSQENNFKISNWLIMCIFKFNITFVVKKKTFIIDHFINIYHYYNYFCLKCYLFSVYC